AGTAAAVKTRRASKESWAAEGRSTEPWPSLGGRLDLADDGQPSLGDARAERHVRVMRRPELRAELDDGRRRAVVRERGPDAPAAAVRRADQEAVRGAHHLD